MATQAKKKVQSNPPVTARIRLTKAAGQTKSGTEHEYTEARARWFVDNDRAEYVLKSKVTEDADPEISEETQEELDSDSQ